MKNCTFQPPSKQHCTYTYNSVHHEYGHNHNDVMNRYLVYCVYEGQEKEIEVMDRDISREEEEEEEEEGEGGKEGERVTGESDEVRELETQESNEEEVTLFKPKMKEFPGTAEVIGLRIRAEPSFLVSRPATRHSETPVGHLWQRCVAFL